MDNINLEVYHRIKRWCSFEIDDVIIENNILSFLGIEDKLHLIKNFQSNILSTTHINTVNYYIMEIKPISDGFICGDKIFDMNGRFLNDSFDTINYIPNTNIICGVSGRLLARRINNRLNPDGSMKDHTIRAFYGEVKNIYWYKQINGLKRLVACNNDGIFEYYYYDNNANLTAVAAHTNKRIFINKIKYEI